MVNGSHFPLIFQCHAAASESGKQRRHQRSNGTRSMPGAVAIDPLARQAIALAKKKMARPAADAGRASSRRDRLTAIGRRRSNIAKKKKSYWGARRWRANGQNGARTDKADAKFESESPHQSHSRG